MNELYQNAVAPAAYEQHIGTGDSGLNMTTVTAAVFKVLKPGGTQVSWTAAIAVGATAAGLTLRHAFSAAPSELDVAGVYIIHAELTVTGGKVTTSRVRRLVRARHEARDVTAVVGQVDVAVVVDNI